MIQGGQPQQSAEPLFQLHAGETRADLLPGARACGDTHAGLLPDLR
jgi:hypothetical protein